MPHHFQRPREETATETVASQAKSCPSCCTLVFVPEFDAPATCPNCREQILLRRRPIDHPQLRHPSRTRPPTPRFHSRPDAPPAPLQPTADPPVSPPTTTTSRPLSHPHSSIPISTLADVTRIRVPTRPLHSLYPGATFQGTQKSGRNSYDVTVTIVDVDFATSFLCGYLCIRGLTDDWPELTTYFDAEIIGSRYGFLTQNWGASENEDLLHWSRFPAFRHIKHDAKRPRLTIDNTNRGAVFMRWKEKFLVPDHRVHDINGASFAGFYYVCVDFNPAATASASGPSADGGGTEDDEHRSGRKQHRNRRGSSARRTTSLAPSSKRSPSLAPYTAPVATMSGFYYHQNSEPYQQLSLMHVPESSSSSFEFR